MSYYWLLLALVALLLLTSLLLFLLPLPLHTRHPSLHVRRCAHRGGAGEKLENTMPAFTNAVHYGADLLEIDVQITLDGEVVIAHDNDMKRVTGEPGLISQTLLLDLPPLQNNLQLQFQQTSCCESDQTDANIVTLRALFQQFPDPIINIDTKEGDQALLEKVSSLVAEYNRYSNTIWGNMNQAVTERLYKVNPRVMMFMSIRKVVWVVISFYLGIIGYVPIKESVLEIPMPSVMVETFMLSGWQRVLGHVIHWLLMNRLFFWHLRQRGIRVVVWVLNQPHQFSEAMGYNVDGIMTDYPQRLDEWYKEQGMAEGQDERSAIVEHTD